MAQAKLISKEEVIKRAPADGSLSNCEFNAVGLVEEMLFRRCLGMDFYRDLVADLKDLSSATKYIPAAAYVIGNLVNYNGIIYQALTDNSLPPTNKTAWKLADKFENACYNTLWCDYLADYISWNVLLRHLPGITYKMRAEGIFVLTGDGKKSADQDGKVSHAANLNTMVSESFYLMNLYLTENKDDCPFDNYKGFLDDCCDTCGETECNCQESCINNNIKRNQHTIL